MSSCSDGRRRALAGAAEAGGRRVGARTGRSIPALAGRLESRLFKQAAKFYLLRRPPVWICLAPMRAAARLCVWQRTVKRIDGRYNEYFLNTRGVSK